MSLRQEGWDPRDLDQFVELLAKAAEAAWRTEGVANRNSEGALYHRQGGILSAAVADLKAILLDHPDPASRADRLYTLHEALGSATVISLHLLEDPITTPLRDRLRDRLHTAAAKEAKLKKSQEQGQALVEVTGAIKRKHPTWSRLRISREDPAVNKLLNARGLGSMKQPTIYDRLKPLWPRIISSPGD